MVRLFSFDETAFPTINTKVKGTADGRNESVSCAYFSFYEVVCIILASRPFV